MTERRSRSIPFVALVAACLVGSGRADAYLDPGTGSVFFQALLATLLAGLYAVKVYWRRIREVLTGRRRKGDVREGGEPPAP